MLKTILSFLTLALFCATTMQAQGNRAASPAAKLEQKVGLTDVTIEYSRPGVKDRVIFADDGLVPFGKLWRTGANAATKITISDAITIGDGELAAGSYAILTKPGAETWDVNFYPYEASRWSGYRDAEPAVTVRATPTAAANKIESFIITIDNLRDNSATLIMAWDKTVVGVPFGVN